MAFTTPTNIDVRDAYLRDLANLNPAFDTGDDSDSWVRGSALGSAVEGIYEHQKWISRQIFPDTADPENLERHAATRGLRLKPAVPSAGLFAATGTPDTLVLPGLTITVQDGREYVATESVIVAANGTVEIPARALVAGLGGDAAPGITGVVSLAPPGMDSAVTVVEMIGGTERETHGSLLERYLFLLRRPPAGGNRYDYIRWALEVPGVSKAYSYPLRRGLGTIDVAITTDDGLPSAETIAAVQAHIDSVRPVTAKGCIVIAPAEVFFDADVLIRRSGISLAAATYSIDQALAAHVATLAPGVTWIRSQSEAYISGITGILDRSITAPVENVVPTIDATVVEWLRLGAVTVGDMP